MKYYIHIQDNEWEKTTSKHRIQKEKEKSMKESRERQPISKVNKRKKTKKTYIHFDKCTYGGVSFVEGPDSARQNATIVSGNPWIASPKF